MAKFNLAWALLIVAGCSLPPHYRKDGPLSFAELPYTSTRGDPWPTKTAALTDVNLVYGLPADTEVAYVELNPTGARTLVFVHGLGSYLKFWRYQLDAFAAQGYRVVALDMLGYGKSSKPATFPYTMEAMADVVRGLVRHLEISRPVLVGHSMGGQTALSYAIRWPTELEALVLTAPAGFEAFSAREKAWFRAVVSTALVRGASEDSLWGSIRRNNFYRWKDEFAWLVEERARLSAAKGFPAYAYANVRSIYGLLETDFTRANLWRIKAPSLIVHGDMDRLIPNPFMHGGETRAVMEYGRQNIGGAKLVTLRGCGHTVQMDCAAEYNAAVKGFLGALPER